MGKEILYVSGSLGLGHVTRDLAIVRELRARHPDVGVSWLAAPPACRVLEQAGEKMIPEAGEYADENTVAENVAQGTRLNVLTYLVRARRDWACNVKTFKRVVGRQHFDLVIADEAYEIALAWSRSPSLSRIPFAMVYDFVGMDAMTGSPLERMGTYLWNRVWSQDYRKPSNPNLLELFVGELDDIPDQRFGPFLPNRREYAKRRYQFLGYVIDFDVPALSDKAAVREELGYGDEPLVVCSIGGTSVGKGLLELCGQAYQFVKDRIPNLQMVLVCGPRLSTDSLAVPREVTVRGYVPNLYRHFAASDLAVVQGGGTTTLELTALRRPFLYFPVEEHFEQQIHVAARLSRHKAGVKMQYSQTTPAVLAEMIVSNMGKEVSWGRIPVDGAQKAVELIGRFLLPRNACAS
jgi:UDP:flavonoid glycosyltransferase YjiC (YdhE family)